MAIITFNSEDTKETGQTLSLAAISTYMAVEHNYKILIVGTAFNDLSLENCFWEYDKIRPEGVINNNKNVGIESGIEGLRKVLASNRTSDKIVKNYTRTILTESRLDMLLSPKTDDYEEYINIASQYADILQMANRYYDMVFVDLSRKIPEKIKKEILETSDLVVLNLTQKLKSIQNYIELCNNVEFYKGKNIMLVLGKYDKFSKYNSKNIMRYLKEKKPLSAVPYNTLFFEASSEGLAVDLIFKIRNIVDEFDRNYIFLNELKEFDKNIIYKLQELQMKI